MAEQSARAADEHLWAIFEAEALPHVDRFFRLAMWFERDRSEAEDLVQETMLHALQSFHGFEVGTNCRAGARPFSCTCGATGAAHATGRSWSLLVDVADVPQADLAKLAEVVAGPPHRGLVGV